MIPTFRAKELAHENHNLSHKNCGIMPVETATEREDSPQVAPEIFQPVEF